MLVAAVVVVWKGQPPVVDLASGFVEGTATSGGKWVCGRGVVGKGVLHVYVC